MSEIIHARQLAAERRRGGRTFGVRSSVVSLHLHEPLRQIGARVGSTKTFERVTAWQNGEIFFDNEPLTSAVEGVNRYEL